MVNSKFRSSAGGLAGLAAATLLAFCVMSGAPSRAQAGTCPTISGGANAPDCNELLTINPDLSISISTPFTTPYDGQDDNYIGIINNSSQVQNHIFLTGPVNPQFGGIFGGMDGDGICSSSFSSTGFTCLNAFAANNQTDTYAPDGVTLTENDFNSGWVDFAGGLLPGQLGIFSLEEPEAEGPATVGTTGVPEPLTLSLFAAGLAGLGAMRRRGKAAVKG